MNNLRNFIKDLTTFRTVWIDRGQGRWAMKKRMHPLLRCVCWLWVMLIGIIVYTSFFAEDTEAMNLTSKRYVPEPAREENAIIMPLKTKTLVQPPVHIEIDQKPEKLRLNAREFFDGIGLSDKNYRILVNKSDYTLSLFKGDELVKQYPIAVGKNPGNKARIGDNRTPEGSFHVVSIENASSWSHDFRDGKGKIQGAYGPWFIRLDAGGWKGIGIHGTHDPDSRGTMATEGCIRLSNEDIRELRQYAYPKMPVVIREN